MKKPLTELEKRNMLKLSHHKKIDYALAKAFINDNDLYELIEDFFREYLDLRYQFTHEELVRELNKMFIRDGLKDKIVGFLDRVSYLQFNAQASPTQEELRKLIITFKEIINGLINFEEAHPKGILEKVKQFLNKFTKKQETRTDSITIPEKKQIPLPKKDQTKIPSSPLKTAPLPNNVNPLLETTPSTDNSEESIKEMLNAVNDALNQNNLVQAKQNYASLTNVYNHLSPAQKQQFYHDIHVMYLRLQ